MMAAPRVKSRAVRDGRLTASQALRVGRRFGVTLDLSNDLELAGKWKHGWIPLDAVAAAVKAKRYHGGGGAGRSVRGKARSGSLVESMRRPSGGRTKAGPRGLTGQSTPRREPHISASPMKDGRAKLTDARSGESVKAVHLASFHDQGHTITGVRGGLMHTRDDYGKRHVYDPATGRAAISPATRRAQQVAQDRTRRLEAKRQPKVSELSDQELRNVVTMYGSHSVQGEAARAEMARRSSESAAASLKAGDTAPNGWKVIRVNADGSYLAQHPTATRHNGAGINSSGRLLPVRRTFKPGKGKA